LGNSASEKVAVRGGIRFAEGRGQLRQAGPEDGIPGCEGSLRESAGRPKPVVDDTSAGPAALTPAPAKVQEPSSSVAAGGNGVASAAASLVEAGVRFLESMASGSGAGETLAGLFTRDERTNRLVSVDTFA
jgi:hypothetical protein